MVQGFVSVRCLHILCRYQFLGTTFLPQNMEIRLTLNFKLFTGMNVYELVCIRISPCGELAACPKCGLLTIKSFLLFLEVVFSAQIIKKTNKPKPHVINDSMYY